MTLTIVLLAALAVLVLLVLASALRTANRLDRLHVRTDAAWAGLEAALGRRAVVTRAVAVSADGAVDGATQQRLRSAADRAESAPDGEKEAAENELSRLLATLERDRLEPALAAELLDAEARVVIARRVHNDAVRDTHMLRRRRVARWLGLAGRAPRPRYFEIAEPPGPDGQ